ncbi:Leucine-rich repeat domain superfamily [Sesbania bispinosa]|nr:Leucine-rich repeat domain superfamily [Sesbania bispinosa]
MSRPTTKRAAKGMKNNGEDKDLISQLPDEVLSCIISSLSIDEAVRSSILEMEITPMEVILQASQMFSDTPQTVRLDLQPKIFSNLFYLDLTNYILSGSAASAFEGCTKLKILKLKTVVMEEETIKGILDNCLGLEKLTLIESIGLNKLKESHTTNIFRNLSTMVVDLDLNNIREALALSFILRSCLYLEALEIALPEQDSSADYDKCALTFPKSMFWERREMYNCINHKLKFVTVKGFTGKEQEVKFVKHLITRATMMKKITVFCNSSVMDEAANLLSLPRASVYLSIIFK